jgi:hypothetical protein
MVPSSAFRSVWVETPPGEQYDPVRGGCNDPPPLDFALTNTALPEATSAPADGRARVVSATPSNLLDTTALGHLCVLGRVDDGAAPENGLARAAIGSRRGIVGAELELPKHCIRWES